MTEFTQKIASVLSKAREEDEKFVTITRKEYERLLDSEHKLECLDAAGVDNWGGYGDAMEMYQEEGDE